MPAFDQWTVQNDNATLSAGQRIKFDIRAYCFLGAPSLADVGAALASSSISPDSITSDTFAPTIKSGATVQGTLKEVVTVGALRAQIIAAGNVMNAAKSVPCTDFEIVDNEISLLTAAGTGIEAPSSSSFGLGLGAVAGLVLVVVVFALYRDLRV